MPIGATIGAVGSIASAGIGAYSSYSASKQQADAAQKSLDFQKQVYGQNQSNLAPWMQTGQNASYSLASLYGLPTPNNPSGGASGVNAGWDAFSKLPAYQFPLQQGNLALERQLNAQGKTQSGAQARETQQFGQGLASQYLMSNYVNPLMQMSGQGQNAASSLAGSSVASAGQIGQSYGNLGTANAAGTMGMGNAISGGANSLALYSSLAAQGGGTSYGGNLAFNSPSSPVSGAVGPTSYGGIAGPMPLNLGQG
jgi:hypothetical protein